MAQLLDRPFIQHVVEQLVTRGASQIDLLLDSRYKAVKELLGDGTRWGVKIGCHLLTNMPSQEDFATVSAGNTPVVVFGDACYLPGLPMLVEDAERSISPSLFFHSTHEGVSWTGWALVPEQEFAAFAGLVAAGSDWRGAMEATALELKKIVLNSATIGVSSPQDVLDSNRIALQGGYPGLYHDGVEKEPGMWIARGVRIAATAVVEAPCYIGEEAWIGENCQIGPFAVIGKGCVVERGTTVLRSVLEDATYLGPELRVEDSSVAQNVIYNVRLGAALAIEEDHVVSRLDAGVLFPIWTKVVVSLAAFLLVAIVLALHYR